MRPSTSASRSRSPLGRLSRPTAIVAAARRARAAAPRTRGRSRAPPRRQVVVDDAADVVLPEDAGGEWPCRSSGARRNRGRRATPQRSTGERAVSCRGRSTPRRPALRRRTAMRGSADAARGAREYSGISAEDEDQPSRTATMTNCVQAGGSHRDAGRIRGARLHEHHHHHVQVVARRDDGREHEHDREPRSAAPAPQRRLQHVPLREEARRRRRPGSRAARA